MFFNFKLKLDDFIQKHYWEIAFFLILGKFLNEQHPSLFLEVLCFLLSRLLGIIG